MNDTWAKWGFEIWPLLEFYWDRMANLGLIDFKLDLYIKVNVNAGQTSLKSISQKMSPKWPTYGPK